MEVGSLQIGGSIDTGEIERGLNIVEKGFNKISTSGKSVEADFIRIDNSTKSLVRNLSLIGAVTGLVALAKDSPAVAGAMAKLEVGFDKIKRSLGEALAPAFNLAVGAMDSITQWINDNKEIISAFGTVTMEGLTIIVKGLTDAWNGLTNLTIPFLDISVGEGLKWLVDTFGATLISGFLSYKLGSLVGLGPAGAAIGVMAGATSQPGEKGKEATIFAATGGTIGFTLGPWGALGGAAIGATIGLIVGAIKDSINRKDATYNAADST